MKDAKYKAPIGALPATVLRLLANIGGAFTKRITHAPSRKIVDGIVTGFGELITALSDANPEDEKQIKAVVHAMVTKGDFYEGSRQSVTANIAKVKNESAKNALYLVLDQVYSVGGVLTDEITDDGEQLETLMRDFLQSEEGIEFFRYLLRIVLEQDTADLIALILVESVRGVLAEDKKEALDRLQFRLSKSLEV